MTLAAFIGVALVHLLAAISPGPSFVLAVRTAATEGFRPAAGLALGFGIGAALWAFAALAGLSLLFQVVPPLFFVVKLAGGLFLIWLAIGMWRHAADPMPVVDPGRAPRRLSSAVRLGLAAMLANPKPAIFFGAVFVGLVPAAADLSDKAIVLFNILWVETLWYVLVARIFALPRAQAAYGRMKKWADRSFGTILGVLGVEVALI
ncbi:Putative threonine efflux protein, RhtB family protein [Oceaniovalibus guishaninsula JLT2003]|uniref:Putative threonine efflux protein, RhtB family protein n=1 Tax=Oceaniovalibus guishaninsula JLT2003 TaxID=1231392 RepID=K2H9G6_9RHOB|nr:LysE family transporter [Oceaniovalibus guishaninsula]EKE44178.1 Putative threonine efflux protein, RhtB family protein [Oceaniovalibus guishaninsula JLT2003]